MFLARLTAARSLRRAGAALGRRWQTETSAPTHALKLDRSHLPQPHYPSFRLPSPTPVSDFVDRHVNAFQVAEKDPATAVNLAGRVIARRDASKKLIFFTLENSGHRVQVVASKKQFDEAGSESWSLLQQDVHVGDILYFSGFPGKTQVGELSLFATQCHLLTPCLHDIPFKHRLRDPEKRIRTRYLDLLVNPDLRSRLVLRSQVIAHIRHFLTSRDFLEVETPVLSSEAGGATARPFVTTANAYDMEMRLRVAPELYLKQLVIGGFDRVFELGKQFRNEGIDANHNPEFTSCEFYLTYANLDTLIGMTEEMLSSLVQRVNGAKSVIPCILRDGTTADVDFSPPYRRIDILPTLEQMLGARLPDLDRGEASAAELVALMKTRQIPLPGQPHTTARLVDQLVSHLIEPTCIQPTFLCGHPRALSPLAKFDPEKNAAARLELFIGGQEVVNAYEELNDPTEQRARFRDQQRDRESGDAEAHPPDEHFCQALEYGLPPTAGWGLGVDRLCMLLAQVHNIREVIAFPAVRSQLVQPRKASATHS
ncbi:hypothetical protein RI367_007616 [Sorochytrium milnesiophthora]